MMLLLKKKVFLRPYPPTDLSRHGLNQESRQKSWHDLVLSEKVLILKILTENIQKFVSTVNKISTVFKTY
jgi:hypothetical protein